MSDDDGDRGEEFDDGYLLVVEGTDATNGEFVET